MLNDISDNFSSFKALRDILIDRATGRPFDCDQYSLLRLKLLSQAALIPYIPNYIIDCQTLDEFWSFIKTSSPDYKGRRILIRDSFKPLFRHIEIDLSQNSFVASTIVTSDYINEEWKKANERKVTDPRGAITSARTLLEATCKHILTRRKIDYEETDDLSKLYGICAKSLTLHPSQNSEQILKEILSGCISVVKGIGSLRNKLGDAHALKITSSKPAFTHSALAVNISCSLAAFLLETDLLCSGEPVDSEIVDPRQS